MTKNTETDKTLFLEELQNLLKKERKTRSLEDFSKVYSDSSSSSFIKESISTTFIEEQPLPPLSDALLSLLTHLTDLEKRITKAENRGPLRPFSKVGETIRTARKRQDLTVQQLASYSNVAPATIHKIESGSIQVHASKLAAVAEALGIELLVTAP